LKPEDKLKELNQMLEHCKNSSFYKHRIPSEPLSSLAEIKKIPITTKEHLRKHYPFGMLCVNREELYQYHESSGTTGVPVSSWFTKEDVYDNAMQIAQCGVDFNEHDTVLIRFPYALSAAAHMIHAAAQIKNACVIPASGRTSATPFPRVVNLMQKLEVTILSCLSLQAVMIAETAELLGLNPIKDFPHLRAICTAGETVTPERRKLLQEIWGVPVFEFYGMTEIGTVFVDCPYYTSHALEDYFIIELLDDNLEHEVGPNEIGNLVITTLKKRATPMLRYLTGDRARMVKKDCGCGKNVSIEIHGRKEDTIHVGERVLDIWDLEKIISHLPCRRFWIVGPEQGGLHFVVEEEKSGDHIDPVLVKTLEQKYNVKLHIEIVPKGTIYDRNDLLTVGLEGKPKYIYSAKEMEQKAYLSSSKKSL
jgi:phenylacetate-CoA ligase